MIDLGRWKPPINTFELSEISMLWEIDLESRQLENGDFPSHVALNYLNADVEMKWGSDKRCSFLLPRGYGTS
jgi:hypothetical protein